MLARSLDREPNFVTFVRHRAFRLLPAAIATIALLTLLHWRFGMYFGYLPSFDPLNVILNALLIKSDINGQMWSLTVEVAAIPLILISHRLFYSTGYLSLIFIIAVLFGLSFYGPYVHALGGYTNLAPFYAFVVGMLVNFHLGALQHKITTWNERDSFSRLAITVASTAETAARQQSPS